MWNATLIDGPLEGRTIAVEEEGSSGPPAEIDIEGQRYVYCGFAENAPRYRHEGEAETV
jgi:hypothetical protein